jgi:subtilisin family serine protease
MATPYTVGTLALYKQAYPNLSAAQLRSKLTRGALDLGTRGKDNIYGYGLIQAPVISTPQDPEDPEEDTTLRTVTDLSVGKDIYKKGSSVAVSVKVVDKDGKAIYRASVKLKIITPTGRTISYSMTTNRNGLASKSFITRSSAYPKGTYELNAISSYKTYETSSDTASFVLQ